TQVNGGAVNKVEDAGSGPIAGDSTLTHYNPETASGYRYGWSVGVETFTRDYYHEHTSAWLGIDFLAADPPSTAWTGVEVLSAPHLLDDGPYYFQDAGTTDAYTFDTDTITASSTFYVTKKTAESTWYGTTTYHKESVIESRDMYIFTHSIEADRPIDVQITGFTSGSIDVEPDADI